MRSFLAPRAALAPAGIHPALWRFADECNGLFARLIAYMGALALMTIVAVSLWAQLPLRGNDPAAAKSAWSPAVRAYPAFAISQFDSPGKTEAYEILRHPDGGRKDKQFCGSACRARDWRKRKMADHSGGIRSLSK